MLMVFLVIVILVANKDKVKAASIEGVQPSLEGIQDYSYPIARPLFFYVKKAHIGVIPGIEEFLKEFTSKKAMSNRGYLAENWISSFSF